MKKSKLIGSIIGPYTILRTVQVQLPCGKKVTKYEVKCNKCGTVEIKQKNQIDRIKSDGCMNCSNRTMKIRKSLTERNYSNYKKKIEQHDMKSSKNLKFNLTLEEFDILTHGNCVYCGAAPSFPMRFKNDFKNREIEHFNGIDRIDSDKNYDLDNCVSCCSMCNRMKSDFNKNDFLKHIEKIHSFNMCSTTIETAVNTDKEVEYIQVDGNGESPNEKDEG